MPSVPVFDADAVFAAVSPRAAIEATRTAFLRHHGGDWVMPAKTYVDAPPNGDFRAMPARGEGLAILKWVTSFPDNPARGLPVVAGALLASSAESGELLAIVDCPSVTSLRTGAAAAVSARALARDDARSVGVIGCGVNGAWAARCLAAAGYGDGVCFDQRAAVAEALAGELGWRTGLRDEAIAQDVVVTVTPGEEPVVFAADLRPGQHYAVLGADAPRQGRDRAGGAGALPPLLRRVGAGVEGRRALGRRVSRPGRARRGHRARRRARRGRARAARRRRRSRCSTRPGSRSRTSESRWP